MTQPRLARSKARQNRTYVDPVTHEEFPSVTTITGMKDKPFLTPWAVKETVEYTIANWDDLAPQTKAVKRFLMKGARYSATAAGTELPPALCGTLVHDMIESKIETGVPSFCANSLQELDKLEVKPVDAMEQLLPRFAQFLAWEKRFSPKWLLSEATVFNSTEGYAGTLDAVAEIQSRHGAQNYLIDFKAAKSTYPEYALQTHALKMGERIVTPDGAVQDMPRVDQMSLLWITPEAATWQQIRWDDATWRAFLGLRDVQRWDVQHAHLAFGTEDVTTAELGGDEE